MRKVKHGDGFEAMDRLFALEGLEGGAVGVEHDREARHHYFAYGSNLNVQQMLQRCPDAIALGPAVLPGWRLVFRGVADVEQSVRSKVRGAVWLVSDRDLRALDRYEGFPHLYGRRTVMVDRPDGAMSAWVYLMVDGRSDPRPEALPSPYYFETILEGYRDFRIPAGGLKRTVARAGAVMLERGERAVRFRGSRTFDAVTC